MYLQYDLIQLLHKELPSLYDLTSERDKLRIPYIQGIAQRRIEIHIFQQLIALVYNLVVIVAGCQVKADQYGAAQG